jgi:hypothetical protein
MSSEDHRWYFVCTCCGAKWFARQQRMHCPRCAREGESKELIIPPWVIQERANSQPKLPDRSEFSSF